LPNVKVPTRFLCRWVPRRTEPRRFTEADAARVMCYATRAGASLPGILKRYHAQCTEARRDRADEEALSALQAAAENIQANNAFLNETYRQFQLVNGLVSLVTLAIGVLPISRALRLVSSRVTRSVPGFEAQILTQRAANDRAFDIVTQAAANEARFLQRAGAGSSGSF